MNFDLELALIATNATETHPAEDGARDAELVAPAIETLQVPGKSQDGERPNSSRQPSSFADRRSSAVTSEDDWTDVDITAQLAEVSGNRPWNRIWDGKTNRGESSPDGS